MSAPVSCVGGGGYQVQVYLRGHVSGDHVEVKCTSAVAGLLVAEPQGLIWVGQGRSQLDDILQ
jgi:hypothetical protein